MIEFDRRGGLSQVARLVLRAPREVGRGSAHLRGAGRQPVRPGRDHAHGFGHLRDRFVEIVLELRIARRDVGGDARPQLAARDRLERLSEHRHHDLLIAAGCLKHRLELAQLALGSVVRAGGFDLQPAALDQPQLEHAKRTGDHPDLVDASGAVDLDLQLVVRQPSHREADAGERKRDVPPQQDDRDPAAQDQPEDRTDHNSLHRRRQLGLRPCSIVHQVAPHVRYRIVEQCVDWIEYRGLECVRGSARLRDAPHPPQREDALDAVANRRLAPENRR